MIINIHRLGLIQNFFPQFPILKLTTKAIERILIGYQNSALALYRGQIMATKKCQLHQKGLFWRTPYQTSVYKFKRKMNKSVIVRKKIWKVSVLGKYLILNLKINPQKKPLVFSLQEKRVKVF